MSVIIWSVLVGVGIALHIFVVMMETGATQGGLGKKKSSPWERFFWVSRSVCRPAESS